jgi:serine/threonine-protein kinase RsbW
MADPMAQTVMTVPALLDGIDEVRRACAARVRAAGVDAETVFEFELALTEALSNTIRHSYGEDPASQILLTLSVGAERIEFVIVDRGIPFYGPERPTHEVEHLGEGGYGLRILAALTDELRREPCADGSVHVTLVKHRRRPS